MEEEKKRIKYCHCFVIGPNGKGKKKEIANS
jgi:hypothetical protein